MLSINGLMKSTGSKKNEALKVIRNCVIASVPKVKMNGRCSREIIIGNKQYTIDIKEEDEIFSVLIYDFDSTINKLLTEVRYKYNLSPREYEVLRCIIDGLDTSEIATHLSISNTTVKKHLINLYKKMEIKGKYQILSVLFNNTNQIKSHRSE